MERRGFLKACAVLMAAPLIEVPDFRLIAPSEIMLPEETWFSTVRELAGYDIGKDMWWLRYDILSGNIQRTFSIRMPSTKVIHDRGFSEERAMASKFFRVEMERNGISLRDLTPLPLPPGYVEPDIMMWAAKNHA